MKGKKIEDIGAAGFRGTVGKRTFELAPQTEIGRLDPRLVDGFLDRIFGMGGALVTDESRLSDFVSFVDRTRASAEAVERIREEYGLGVDIREHLVVVLRRIARGGSIR